ncbi:glycosyltransferase [Microbacterium sp. 22303]|uniref:glycosyltransferase n=1 Tax=Microbacterium sp. 22303 TaxID=3453905 RepID=UPI003F83E8F1
MVIEVVRGLGLGGAESLLLSRLEYEAANKTSRTARVINTHSPENYLQSRVAATGVVIDDLETGSRWSAAVRLWRVAREFEVDESVVVHSPWPAAVLKLRRAFGMLPSRLVEVAHSTSYALPTRVLGRLLNRYADLCIAVSPEVADSVTTIGFRQKRVILAGVDRGRMRQWIVANPHAVSTFRRELGMDDSAPLVVSVGNLYEDKRHKLLLESVASLPEKVHVVIVGEGPARDALERQIDEMGMSSRVHLLGRRADAWQWMAVADVVAHPSAREGLPIALTEARVVGVPTVAFDVGGVSSVLDESAGSKLLPSDKPQSFGPALADAIRRAPAAGDVFGNRASVPSTWDVGRYADDFYHHVQH